MRRDAGTKCVGWLSYEVSHPEWGPDIMHSFIGNTQCRRGSWPVNAVLIVVVILVVAAVLMPICARYRIPIGPHRTCQGNMRLLATALQFYYGDYDGVLPSSIAVNGSKTWNKADFLRFGTKIGHLCPPPDRSTTYAEILVNYLTRWDILFCPSDRVNPYDPNASCSYWWKLAIDKAWYGVGCRKPCRSAEKDFPYSADTIVLYERRGFHTGGKALNNAVQINVLFLDSHVSRVTLKNATSGDPANCAANSDGEPNVLQLQFQSWQRPARRQDPCEVGGPGGIWRQVVV